MLGMYIRISLPSASISALLSQLHGCELEDSMDGSPRSSRSGRLTAHASVRYGSMNQVTSHPIFETTDWTNLRGVSPPFVPSLDSRINAEYYDGFPWLHDTAKYEAKEKQGDVARIAEDDGHSSYIWYDCYDKGHESCPC